jgi:hypothetical protein
MKRSRRNREKIVNGPREDREMIAKRQGKDCEMVIERLGRKRSKKYCKNQKND